MYWGPLGTSDGDRTFDGVSEEECKQDDASFTDADGDGCSAYATESDSVCGVAGYEATCTRCCRTCGRAPNCAPDGRYYDPSDRWDTLAARLANNVLATCPR